MATPDTSLKDYGADVFSEKAIRAHLPKTVASKLIATMRDAKPLDPSIAEAAPPRNSRTSAIPSSP